MNIITEFQVPWYFIFWMSVLCCGFASFLLKRFLKVRRSYYVIVNFIVIFVVMMASSIFSYSKLIKINELIAKGKFISLKNQVTKVEYFNGKDVVFLDDELFEINHHDLYCVSGKKVLSKGDYVSLIYVDLGSRAGFINGNCIISIKKLIGSNK